MVEYDAILSDFPKLDGEAGDEGRIIRAAESCERGVLYIPGGVYEIHSTIEIRNACSLKLHPNAVLKAVEPMDFVMRYDDDAAYPGMIEEGAWLKPNPDPDSEYWNPFITGGIFDGNGLASCLVLNNFKHFTLRDISLRNGKKFGLLTTEPGTHWTYELVAQNIYCKCTMPGLGGNTAICLNDGDNHLVDCICVDYTIGFDLTGGGSNRLTRCHVWGGPIPPRKEGELPEMLNGSINYRLTSGDALLTDCYADTGKIGYEINDMARLIGCSYYNNYQYKMDDVTVIRHTAGQLLVTNCVFRQHSPHATMYDGTEETRKQVVWQNNLLEGGLTF